MSESLRNDGRVWVPKTDGDKRPPEQIPKPSATTSSSGEYPSFGNLVPRDVASRNAKSVCDEGRGVGESGLAVYLDFTDAISARRRQTSSGRATATSSTCTGRSPTRIRTRCRCGSIQPIHYTMGGLWVDYNLMSNLPGCTSSARPTSPITARTGSARARSCRDSATATS